MLSKQPISGNTLKGDYLMAVWAVRVAMLGSNYLGSQLYRTWPIFSWYTCTICGKEYRREWLWKFLKRRKHMLERPQHRHACFHCVTENYNEAVMRLDKHYRELTFSKPPRTGSGVQPPRKL